MIYFLRKFRDYKPNNCGFLNICAKVREVRLLSVCFQHRSLNLSGMLNILNISNHGKYI